MGVHLHNKIESPDIKTSGSTVRDSLDRPCQDLRISVIDQCNFRCTYCMPEERYAENYTFLNEEQWLTFGEIERLVRLFVRLGVTKVRLTGGEPLLRPNLIELIKNLKNIDGITDLALTTNGSLLPSSAQALKDAGLNRITVSLDTLDARLFQQINGKRGNLQRVLDGIQKCEDVGFEHIKINAVLQKNINDHHIIDLVRYFKGRKPILRFIEYMDVGNCNHWNKESVISADAIGKMINTHFPIEPVESNYFGEVATRFKFLDGSGEIGLISSITQPFCRSCTRARLSTDGTLYTCLFASQGTDLRTYLHQNASDEEIVNILHSAWQKRDDRYSELRTQSSSTPQNSPKIEMFQIGG